MTLALVALRDDRVVATCPLDTLPVTVGSKEGSDLRLDDPDVPRSHGRVVLGSSGQPELRPKRGGDPIALAPGVHAAVGPFTLGVVELPGATREGEDLVGPLLAALPRLWCEAEGRADHGALVELMVELLGAEWGALARLGDDEAPPEILAQAGRRPGGEAPLSRTVLRRATEAAGPVLVGAGDEAPVESIPLQVRSVIAAPLTVAEETAGWVYLESSQTRRTFGPAEREALRTLCEFAAAHLGREGEVHDLRARQERLGELYRDAMAHRHGGGGLVGSSPALRAVVAELEKAAPTDVTTLLVGESGTGKELAATALHRGSRRAAGPFVAVNTAALPTDLVESELFGHVKGAFSGATADRLGRFQLASGGTLFLDEIGDLPLASQGKLLRALENRTVQRVGEAREQAVDVRIVAATHVDLAEAVAEGRFREDLFFRLSVFTVRIPPLRDRPEDIPDLVEHLVPVVNRALGTDLLGVTAQALEVLRAHPWPGNVRELRNVLEQASIRAPDRWITAGCLALPGAPGRDPEPAGPAMPDELDAARALFERAHIRRILGEVKGDVAAAAGRLAIARSNLYKRLAALHIDPAEFR